ncbi:hypothetical protein PJ267_13770 [Arthrobacter sp. OVS8]|nr:hypothetical protein PJ267_13770 [Arthrobacter sp. OVS8]
MGQLVLQRGGVFGESPRDIPYTSSPTANRVTAEPTAATVPATSMPGTGFFGLRNPNPRTRRR